MYHMDLDADYETDLVYCINVTDQTRSYQLN